MATLGAMLMLSLGDERFLAIFLTDPSAEEVQSS